jgi:SAM-dependent methyltransferase
MRHEAIRGRRLRYPPLTPAAAMRWDTLRRMLPESLGDVLEIGCGQGGFAARLAPLSRSFLGLEPDSLSFEVSRRRAASGPVTILNVAAEQLSLHPEFDTVCAFEVLEHVEDDRAALHSWVSRLRPGGTLLVSVPAFRDRFGPSDEAVGHFRRYDPSQFAGLLSEAGLEDVRLRLYGHPIGQLLDWVRNRLAERLLRRARLATGIAERTASSGRWLQPDGPAMRFACSIICPAAVAMQRFFPNRGIALLAIARKPG